MILPSALRGICRVLLLCALTATNATAADKFPKNCTVPYNGTSKHHNVDKVCPPQGKVDPSEGPQLVTAHEAQNRRKNELCDFGTPKAKR